MSITFIWRMRRLFAGLFVVTLLGGIFSQVGLPLFSTSSDNGEHGPAKSTKDSSAMSAFRAVFITVPSIEVGKKIASGLVSQKLAACVNIIPQITSVYEWEGKINEDSEILLMIKTQSHLFESLSTFVKENHPYEVPEIIGLPIEQGSQSYLDWIRKSTSEALPPSESKSSN